MRIHLCIFLLLIPQFLCFLRKKSKALVDPKQAEEEKYLEYGKSVLEKMNTYRKEHEQTKSMVWLDKLAESAKKEAKEIILEKRFGSHDKFTEWENQIRNDYFTEIAVKIQWNDKKLPEKDVFAQDIVTALIQDDKFYIMQDYSSAGIGIEQDSQANEYIVVLHFAENSKKFTCKDALDSGNKVKQVTIYDRGKQEILQCDQTTEGGGWTLIADVDKYARGERTIIPIDDRLFDYTQILFEAKPYFYFNYVSGNKNQWDFDSYNFRQCALRFGDEWYADKRHQAYALKYINYDRTTDIKVLERGQKCFYATTNEPDDCATKFIFTVLPKGKRVDGFSEMESAANVAFQDNIYRFYFKLYVR